MQRFVSRCIPLVLILECVCAYTSLNLSNSTVLEHLAGVESLVPAGRDSGPFLLLNTASGLCIQPAADKTSASGHQLLLNSVELVLHSEGCNNTSSRAHFLFTASGKILHNKSGMCVGPLDPHGQGHASSPVILKDCHTSNITSNVTDLQWTVTAQASLVHRLSGMCLHPSGGSPQPGVSLQLHQECNKERVAFRPVRPEHVEFWLTIKASEDRLDLNAGRKQSVWPTPLCCSGGSCVLKPRKQRKNTFLTTARASNYVQALKGLVCSLAKSNPGSHLIVMGATSDSNRLSQEELEYLKHNASMPGLTVKYLTVADIDFPNYDNPRFHLNWIKLQAWNLTEWDAIIMLDADMAVLGDLKHLFNLPHHYASAPEQAPGFPWNSGGFKFLRPCHGMFEHMLHLLLQYPSLQFRTTFSEQSFLNWYFRYDAVNLPFAYHANAHQHPDLRSAGTVTGLQPILLHFADKKPWEVPNNDALYKYANPCRDSFPVSLVLPSTLPIPKKHVRRHHRRRADASFDGWVE